MRGEEALHHLKPLAVHALVLLARLPMRFAKLLDLLDARLQGRAVLSGHPFNRRFAGKQAGVVRVREVDIPLPRVKCAEVGEHGIGRVPFYDRRHGSIFSCQLHQSCHATPERTPRGPTSTHARCGTARTLGIRGGLSHLIVIAGANRAVREIAFGDDLA